MYCIITDEEAVHFAPYSAPILHFATLGSFAFARYHNILGLPSFLHRPFVEGFRALVEAHVEEVRREEAAEGAGVALQLSCRRAGHGGAPPALVGVPLAPAKALAEELAALPEERGRVGDEDDREVAFEAREGQVQVGGAALRETF